MSNIEQKTFQVKAHILKLLGEELIGSNALAVFELVKNAYDADATLVQLTIDADNCRIVIEDNGTGMDLNTIENGWLTIGSELKRGKNKKNTLKYHRVPLGEKGVGRLAAFKLGQMITITTKAENNNEYLIVMESANTEGLIENFKVDITKKSIPETFTGKSVGTKLVIDGNSQWDRKSIRSLYRSVQSIISPFNGPEEFRVKIDIKNHNDWLDGILSSADIIRNAMYKFSFELRPSELGKPCNFNWKYEFVPPTDMGNLLKKTILFSNETIERYNHYEWLDNYKLFSPDGLPSYDAKNKVLIHNEDIDGIGRIKGHFYIYTLNHLPKGNIDNIKSYLKENAGIKVFKNGIRVFNYGEPNNDWLGLNVSRVNAPYKVSNNTIIGYIALDSDSCVQLKEKTNREGFDENQNFRNFEKCLKSVIEYLDKKRTYDKDELDKLKKSKGKLVDPKVRFDNAIEAVLKEAEKANIKNKIEPNIRNIQKDYYEMREVAMRTGLSTLNLTVFFHEIERSVLVLKNEIDKENKAGSVTDTVNHIHKIIESLKGIFRAKGNKNINVSTIIDYVYGVTKARFKRHEIIFSCPMQTKEDEDFQIYVSSNLVISAIQNIIENAIYWTRLNSEQTGGKPAIIIRCLKDWNGLGKSIAVIDNGTGFKIPPEKAMEAFIGTRPEGMGLGLYYAKMIMDAHGGHLTITDAQESDIETKLTGAAVILSFKERK